MICREVHGFTFSLFDCLVSSQAYMEGPESKRDR